MPIPTHGFDAPPSATGSPYPSPIVQEGDPGAVGPGTWWVIPSTGATMLRNETNTGWITTSSGASIPPATTISGPDAFGASPAVGTGTHYARDDHDHGLPGNPSPIPATTVTGPDAFGASPAVGTGVEYARDDHDHGLPAVPPANVVSPLVGASGGGGHNTGGTIEWDAGTDSIGGDALIHGGEGLHGTHGGYFHGHGGRENSTGTPAGIEAFGDGDISGNGELLKVTTGATLGVAGQLLGSDGSSHAVWLTPLIRNAAGVPSGAPGAGELPIAADTTASPATLYFWDGAAWVVTV